MNEFPLDPRPVGVRPRPVGQNLIGYERFRAGWLWQSKRQDPGGLDVQPFHRGLAVLLGKYPVILPQLSCLRC